MTQPDERASVKVTAYEMQVLIGTSISGRNMPPDETFDLKAAWARLYALGLIDRTDGLAIATPAGLAIINSAIDVTALKQEIERLRGDAERWQALMSSPKMHFMGSAGFAHTLRDGAETGSRLLEDQIATPKPGEAWHFGMEFWFGIPADACYPDTFERQMLTAYVDAIRAIHSPETVEP